MVAAVLTAFAPALDIFLAGDDFEWLEASYDLVSNPLASFDKINHFFRPFVKWTYLGDYVLFGGVGIGYVATNLIIHFLNVGMLFAFLRRRLGRPLVAAGAAAAFALSPLHSEAVLWAAGRPDTVLLSCWLGALLFLDRWCDQPGSGRAAAFTTVALLGAGAKESWIVFPFLAAAYVVLVRRESMVAGIRRTAILWAGWLAYLAVFLIGPALGGRTTATHYADFAVWPALVKTSKTLLGYCGLGWVPVAGWSSVVLAATVVSVAIIWLIRTDNRFGAWALLWMAATLALVAPFSVSALRHNYLPLVGFWMLIAAVVDNWLTNTGESTAQPRHRIGVPLTVAAMLIVVVLEGWLLQREIADYRLYGELHARLCQSFAVIEPQLARDRPVALINRGTLPGVELMASSVQGGDKTFFVRRDALWQLVFFPALANFVGHPFDERLVRTDPSEHAMVGDGCTVLLFTDDGFELRPDLERRVMSAMSSGELPPTIGVYRYERLSVPGG